MTDDHADRSGGGEASPTPAPEVTPPTPHPLRRWLPPLAAGLAGAVTLTLLNEGVRRVLPHAPRMEVIGGRALSDAVEATGAEPPTGRDLYRWSLAGDLVSNTLYYGLVGLGTRDGAWTRGGALGLAAGLGAAFLPGPLGLGRPPGERRPLTPALTVAWYLTAGLAAAAVSRGLVGKSNTQN